MQPKLITRLALLVTFLGVCAPMFAHHGNSQYDEKHPVTVTGTVTEFVWQNPDCQIYIDVKDKDGKLVHWGIESMSPGVMLREGWNPSMLNPGDVVSVTLIAAKNGARWATREMRVRNSARSCAPMEKLCRCSRKRNSRAAFQSSRSPLAFCLAKGNSGPATVHSPPLGRLKCEIGWSFCLQHGWPYSFRQSLPWLRRPPINHRANRPAA